MRTCVEGLCAVPMEAGLYHILTFVKARVLIDQNISLKVMSGGWSMRKDSVTTARKRLERCVFVMVIFLLYHVVEDVFQSHETINATVRLVYL